MDDTCKKINLIKRTTDHRILRIITGTKYEIEKTQTMIKKLNAIICSKEADIRSVGSMELKTEITDDRDVTMQCSEVGYDYDFYETDDIDETEECIKSDSVVLDNYFKSPFESLLIKNKNSRNLSWKKNTFLKRLNEEIHTCKCEVLELGQKCMSLMGSADKTVKAIIEEVNIDIEMLK